MYTLTLTRDERKAIDWIGDRYWNGQELFVILMGCDASPDVDWDSPEDITFVIDEPTAWILADKIEGDEGVPCFGPALTEKMYGFSLAIV